MSDHWNGYGRNGNGRWQSMIWRAPITAIALFLVWWMTSTVDKRFERIERTLQRNEWLQRVVCANTAPNEDIRRQCEAAPYERYDERRW